MKRRRRWPTSIKETDEDSAQKCILKLKIVGKHRGEKMSLMKKAGRKR